VQGAESEFYNYSLSDASISSSSSYGIGSCGSTLGIRKQTNFGASTVSLPDQSSYYTPPGTYIIGFHSNGWTHTKVSSFSVNVENLGFISPTPSLCTGGGNITDSFTISH